MNVFDILLTLIYLILVFLIGYLVQSRHKGEFIYEKYFMKGLAVKLIGGVTFAMVYTFYYTYGGDTKVYFHDGAVLVDLLKSDPIQYIKVLLADGQSIFNKFYDLVVQLRYTVGTSEWFTVKITSALAFLGGQNYFATTVLFAGGSYIGIWKFYTVLYRRYPGAHRAMAFSILFVPSVFFWGSGIMKDSIVIGFLGLLTFYADRFIYAKMSQRWIAGLMIALCSYIIFNVKAYVLISLLPALLIWGVMSVRERMKSKVLRILLLPMLLITAGVFVAFAVSYLGQFSAQYNVETILDTANGMQTWHYVEGENTSGSHGRGSSYTLGDYEPTIEGVSKMFIPAVNVTLYRPYLWEVKNVAMLASSIESTLVLLFSLFIFIGLGFFRVLKLLSQDAFLLMAITFAIFFAFAVGFTSYNFGALARYKIPCIPFYLSSLFILRYKVKELKASKEQQFQKSKFHFKDYSKRVLKASN